MWHPNKRQARIIWTDLGIAGFMFLLAGAANSTQDSDTLYVGGVIVLFLGLLLVWQYERRG
jgi:hypothetical protein